ncbi:MAG: DUF2867 domain-containing protein [Luteimonas sp.]
MLGNRADIPALTEVLTPGVQVLLEAAWRNPASIATTALSLHAPPASIAACFCAGVRGAMGRLRAGIAQRRAAAGFRADNGGGRDVVASGVDADSLLQSQLPGRIAHEDQVALRLDAAQIHNATPARVMDHLLAGFVENPPDGVSRLMALRNVLVRPAGLRTSPLGCPASSLLSSDAPLKFAGRHPVVSERRSDDGRRVEVILGADDRHLMFRTCVGVRIEADGAVVCTMATRVRTRNPFGRFYMAAISGVHRRYIAPAMLRHAADHAVRSLRGVDAVGTALLTRNG